MTTTTVKDETQRPIRIRFAADIKQVSPNEIEIVLPTTNGDIFDEVFVRHLNHELGRKDASLVLEDAAHKILGAQIAALMRIM